MSLLKPPEQTCPLMSIDDHCRSVGCILYELSCLQHPFMPAENLPQLMNRVVNKEPSFHGWAASAPLRTICKSLLNKNPKKRPDAKQLLAEAAILEHVKVGPMRHEFCRVHCS